MVNNRNVSLDRDRGIVVKSIKQKDAFNLELNTSIAARKIAIESGLFYVPEILSSDQSKNSITFEYLSSLTPLYAFLQNPGKHNELLRLIHQVGQVLGIIHSKLILDDLKVPIPFKSSYEMPVSFLHGDYNLNNVQYDFCGKGIIVLDWAFTPIIQPSGNWGPVYWDIAWMLNSLFSSKPNLKFDFYMRKALAETFLRAYMQSTVIALDSKYLSCYSKDVFWFFARASRKRKGLLKFLQELPNRYGLKVFTDNLYIRGIESLG